MSKYLSWIGVLLVLVVFHLGPNAEAQVIMENYNKAPDEVW